MGRIEGIETGEMMKIAISVSEQEKSKGEKSPYFRALCEAGAAVEELQLVAPAEDSHLRVEDFDGLLLAGGSDVDPVRYGEEIEASHSVRVDGERDEFEFRWLDRARRIQLPVLGICRGVQVINVTYRGSLYQDLEQDFKSDDAPAIRHRQPGTSPEMAHAVVVTDPESRLAKILPARCEVNSRHHQGIKRTGHGLRNTAHAEDGLVEALEAAEPDWYLLAVQWHPEDLVHLPEQRKLFEQFLAESKARAKSRE
jgi:gamma-glutamyl-gamma-aminobutyrate hydrolase PuuD